MLAAFNRLPALLFALLLTLGLAVPALAQSGPAERIEEAADIFLGILQNDGLNRDERNRRIREEAFRLFDERAIAQSVLSTNWRQASAEQQQEFQDLLARLLESTYIDRLDAYSGQSVEVGREDIRGNRATVDTVVLSEGANVPVVYRLRELNGEWLVYDVVIENVSLVNSYRESYLSVVRRSGIDGLLQQMRDKLAELEQQTS